jgi:hypothetical protein
MTMQDDNPHDNTDEIPGLSLNKNPDYSPNDNPNEKSSEENFPGSYVR